MRKTNYMLLGFVLVTVLVGGVVAQPKLAPSEEREDPIARELWEAAIVAKGGREKLEAIQNMVVSIRLQQKFGLFKNEWLEYEQFYVFPYKLWSWSDERPAVVGLNVDLADLEKGIRYGTMPSSPEEIIKGSPYPRDEEDLRHAQILYLMETKWIKPRPLKVRKEKIRDTQVDVVETTISGEQYDFYLNQVTHLPIRIVRHYVGKHYETKSLYSYRTEHYVTVNGFQMPQITGKTDGAKEQTKYQINVAYDPQLFELPPTIEAGPEAWKPKK